MKHMEVEEPRVCSILVQINTGNFINIKLGLALLAVLLLLYLPSLYKQT